MVSQFAFTLVNVLFFYYDLYSIDATLFKFAVVSFWIGVFVFSALIFSGLNKKYIDHSLTVPQLLWGTCFLLIMIYLLNEWRALVLMAYFGMLSFGFFNLKFRAFLYVSLFAISGYAIIILYLYVYEPWRIMIKLELAQLLVFINTVFVMLYTDFSINRLRKRAKKQYSALHEAMAENKKLATLDDLTGLYNRRYFMEQLSKQKMLSERDGSDFVIAYCDLDYFKRTNDTFGHYVGDTVLKKFSEILKTSIREIDYAARFGGEEFVCLLVNTDIESAKKITERIRSSLEKYNFNDVAPSLRATASIGIANFKQFKTIQETLVTADNRMYLAKQRGRNKIVFSDDSEVKEKQQR
ncbi:diguanylate cyclase/phosphodiesterase (GGDEF & EAL domains) with PAS/PAC sensor(s) [hydrothermal vent metagenome]|uniref:Diguanylate cyclase/phosphodiesterase (GGDEF & EAL domains) with PAS/PAC sensor(S) n=1 Tax=hydrothermal vent metagenome TaxID=652676 RepID=A0A3B0WAF8_9ZZZZ